MGWIRALFGRLFNIKQATRDSSVQPASKPHKQPGRQKQPASQQHDSAPESMDTVGWLLQHISVPRTPQAVLNPARPPALDRQVRGRLQATVSQIPPMPEIWHSVQQILQDSDASATQMGNCIAKDPVLTARILTLCNTAGFAGPAAAELTNINLAIARLGMDTTATILFQTLAPELGGSEYKHAVMRNIWFHAQAISRLCRILSEAAENSDRHAAALAGVLHDIGKLVMVHGESESALQQLQQRIGDGADALAAEHEMFGYTHIDAGMMLALHWRLPPYVKQLIALHHHPDAVDSVHLPEKMRPLMLTLHTAHLILQHQMQRAEDEAETALWQGHQRRGRDDLFGFVRDELHVPTGSSPFYANLCSEIDRLQMDLSQ